VRPCGRLWGVFNSLLMYDQRAAQNSPDSIVTDLATGWAWSDDGKQLTFSLHQASNARLPTVHRCRRQMLTRSFSLAVPIISQPYVEGLTTMVNSIYDGLRMEEVWLDK